MLHVAGFRFRYSRFSTSTLAPETTSAILNKGSRLQVQILQVQYLHPCTGANICYPEQKVAGFRFSTFRFSTSTLAPELTSAILNKGSSLEV